MPIIGDALRQAFMPNHEYESLRGEEKAFSKLQKPALMLLVSSICLVIVTCTIISLNIVFPSDGVKRPFCGDKRFQPLQINLKYRDSDLLPGAFYLTDAETADYFWIVLFILSTIIFSISAVYLFAGKHGRSLMLLPQLCIYFFLLIYWGFSLLEVHKGFVFLILHQQEVDA
ncbi:hypothetical protein SAY87_026076 [Trapa incisa]|uniref:Uncharacterized protein n=1 Tax=Trapa incisa TaxID=236973 RepID=A0AAN7JJN3_9MYRT|nr:hypothetical protein SAY87_026076 [Trapa incisa]